MYWRTRNVVGSPSFVVGCAIVAGIAGLVASVAIPNPFTRTLPPLVLLGAAVGYRLRDEELTVPRSLPLARVATIAYLLVAAAVVFQYAANGFTRTTAVHGLTLGLFLLSALVLFTDASFRHTFALVLATGLLHRGTIYYASAVQIGNDGLFHNRTAEAIAASGSLAPLATDKYWYAPVYHLLTASGVSAFGISARHAAFLLVTASTTALLLGVVCALLARVWDETIALLGGWLLLVADRAVVFAVHTTTTSLGLALFALLLLCAERHLETASRSHLALFGGFLLGLAFTHQLSLFVAFVCVGGYVLARTAWDRRVRRRGVALLSLLAVSVLAQASITEYGGPEGNSESFLTVVGRVAAENLASIAGGASSRPETRLPPGEWVALAGADAMSVFHVAGAGFLFALGLVGAVRWLNRADARANRVALGLGASVVLASGFAYALPMAGVSTFLPDRWQVFLYVALVLLAAPGVAALLSAPTRRVGRTAAVLVVLVAVFAPYAVVMTGNGVGAPDGAVIDDAPAADRLSTTPHERGAYEFVVDHADEETIVVADHVATQVISRHYERPAVVYRTRPNEPGTVFVDEQLLVYRGYAATNHGSYRVVHEDVRHHVYGPLPGPVDHDAVVYTNGDDRIVWRAGQ